MICEKCGEEFESIEIYTGRRQFQTIEKDRCNPAPHNDKQQNQTEAAIEYSNALPREEANVCA